MKHLLGYLVECPFFWGEKRGWQMPTHKFFQQAENIQAFEKKPFFLKASSRPKKHFDQEPFFLKGFEANLSKGAQPVIQKKLC